MSENPLFGRKLRDSRSQQYLSTRARVSVDNVVYSIAEFLGQEVSHSQSQDTSGSLFPFLVCQSEFQIYLGQVIYMFLEYIPTCTIQCQGRKDPQPYR